MGGCFKKDFKDTIARSNSKIISYENNLLNMGLQNSKMKINDFEKLYTQMLESFKITAKPMLNSNNNTLDHYYKVNNQTKSNLALKSQIKKIQAEVKLLHMQLPIYLSNSIFICQAISSQNFMKALISGSDNTPYANGLFLYDIFLPDDYPNSCPKMQLITTGGNTIRFNPNLYNNGYVCLSLLGTWRGDSVESWNPKTSNLLQVLLSIQSLVMSEGVYYNEPSYETEYKTKQGRAKNIGYSNIVRYGTVKYAINQMIKNPPKGFEEVVKLHFAIKSNFIMRTLDQWVANAQKDNSNATYDGLVSSHNYQLANEFGKNNSNYKKKLQAEVDIAKNLIQQVVQELVKKDQNIFLKQMLEENKKENQNIDGNPIEEQKKENEEMEVEEEKENIKDKEDNSIILENQDKKIESLESLDGFKKILSEEKPEIEFTEKSYLNYSF